MSRSARNKALLFTALATLMLAGGAVYYTHGSAAQAAEEHAAGGPAPGPMPVTVIVAAEKPLRLWSSFSGRLAAVDRVELRPQVSGAITEVKFEDGQLVEAGDTLFVIEPAPYEARVAQAEADLKAAQNQQQLAQKDLDRAAQLVKNSTISERIFDERESTAKVTRSSVEAAKARLDQARIDLDHAYVKAPISGRVSRAEITVGNLVQAGSPLLTTIVSNEGIYADFEVDEKLYLQSLRNAGDEKIPVRLVLKSDENVTYDGYIKSFDNQIDTTSGTIRARALFDNADGALLPGMFVSVEVGGASAENRIMIPEQAVSTDQDRKFVYVVGDDGKVAYRPVTLGAAVAGQREIKGGLTPGDKIVTEGIMKIRPDMVVAPQIAAAAAEMPVPDVTEADVTEAEVEPAAAGDDSVH